MKTRRLAPNQYPDWPAVLSQELAAAYIGISPTAFRTEIAPQVPPIHITQRRVGWVRLHLDAWIARQASGGSSSMEANPWDK